MKLYDLKELLGKAYYDGFTNESINKITGVSIELIERYNSGLPVEKTEVSELGKVTTFLSELYRDSITQDSYIREVTYALDYFFDISDKTIANYLNISMDEFNDFLQKPNCNEKKDEYTLKLLHLFISVVRDKKYF